MKPLVVTASMALTGCLHAPVLDAKLTHAVVGALLVLYALVISRPRRALP